MSVADLRKQVLTVFIAENADHKKKVNEIMAAEKDLASVRKKGIEDAIKLLGDLGHAMGSIKTIGTGVWSAWKSSMEQARLANASAGISIDALAKSAGGLHSKMELMAFAAKTSHGAFKLTQAQMETATAAMRQMTREGGDQEEVMKKVTDAIVKLEGDALKDFGVRVKSATSDAGKFDAIMEALTGKARKVGDGTKTAAEEMATFGTRTTDAFDRIKDSIGKLAAGMQPLLDKVASLIELMAQAAQHTSDSGGWDIIMGATGASWVGDEIARAKKNGQIVDPLAAMASGYTGISVPGAVDGSQRAASRRSASSGPSLGEQFGARLSSGASGGLSKLGDAAAKKRGGTGASDYGGGAFFVQEALNGVFAAMDDAARSYAAYLAQQVIDAEDLSAKRFNGPASDLGALDVSATGRDEAIDWSKYGADSEEHQKLSGAAAEMSAAAYDVSMQEKSKNFLEETFGPIDSFNAYAAAFETLTGASSAAFGAWIDGSKSASEAFGEFIKSSLKGVAQQLLAEGIKEGVFALGSLAMGDMKGAALHGAASAKAFVGAGVVGALAKIAYGPSGGGGAAGGSSGGSHGGGGSGSSGGDNGPRSIVIVTGNDTTDDTQRMRQIKARRYVELGLGSVGYGVDDK